jgi:hypothetical protein
MITDAEIKVQGMKALNLALGEVGAEKFVTLLLRAPFDYTQWQRQLWPGKSVAELSQAAMQLRQAQRSGGRKVRGKATPTRRSRG